MNNSHEHTTRASWYGATLQLYNINILWNSCLSVFSNISVAGLVITSSSVLYTYLKFDQTTLQQKKKEKGRGMCTGFYEIIIIIKDSRKIEINKLKSIMSFVHFFFCTEIVRSIYVPDLWTVVITSTFGIGRRCYTQTYKKNETQVLSSKTNISKKKKKKKKEGQIFQFSSLRPYFFLFYGWGCLDLARANVG